MSVMTPRTEPMLNGCDSKGCYLHDVICTGTSISQLNFLRVASGYCEQFISYDSYECKHSKLFAVGKGWWVSRSGEWIAGLALLIEKVDVDVR